MKINKVIYFDLCLLALLAVLWGVIPGSVGTAGWSRPFDAGESWIFVLPGTYDNNWFPFFPVVISTLQYHLPAWLGAGACKALFLLPVLLAFCAGSLLYSVPAGILSAALSAVLSALLFHYGFIIYEQHAEQILFTVSLLMLVCGLSLKFRSYTPRSFFIGLLLAVALYAKGVIALFLPVVFVCEAYREKGRALFLRQWPAMTVLLAVIAAWVIVNWVCSVRFVILEGNDRASCNIVEGALGFVSTLEVGHNWPALSGYSGDQSAFLWAVREIAAHPLRYVWAIASRLQHLLFVKPLVPGLPVLFFLWLCGIYRLRRLAAVRPLLLLTFYLLLLHLLMPVEGRYFLPVWFLACPLTGIFFAALLGGAPQPGGYGRTNAKAVFYGVSAPVIAFWAFSFILLIAYPLRSRAPRDLRELETKYPACPWIHEIAAREALSSGDLVRAADSRRKAYEAEKLDSHRIDYLTTAFMAGSISGDQLLREESRNVQNHYPLLLAALRYIEEGEPAKAGKILPCALQLCVRNSGNMRYISNDREVMLLREVRRNGAEQCVKSLSEIIDLLDVKRRDALRDRLGRSYPGARRPERLFSDFIAENGEENTRTGSPTPYSGPTIQACRDIGLVAAPGPAPRRDKI